MSLPEKLFLGYVILAFSCFGVALITVSLWSRSKG